MVVNASYINEEMLFLTTISNLIKMMILSNYQYPVNI